MRYSMLALLTVSALCAFANVGAEEAQVFSNSGFSIAFPENWHAHKITDGMISATTTPSAPIYASAKIYYGILQPNATQADKAKFRTIQKKHSLRDYVSSRELKASRWHSKITTESLNENVSVEQMDVEMVQKTPESGKHAQPVCNFFRNYHTPQAELHLTYSQRGSCAAAKPDFDSFSKWLIWNVS